MSDTLPPAVKQELLEQLAEQTKRGAIKDMQTKSGMLALALVQALIQLWIGNIALSIGPPCAQHLHWWLTCDGAASSVGMMIGLTVSIKAVHVARHVAAHQWLQKDGKDRDSTGDLVGVWRRVRQLSDLMDCVVVSSFLWGGYCLSTSNGDSDGDGCDDNGRSSVWRALVLKPLAPMVVTVALKGWHMLSWGSSPVPPKALAQQRKRK